MNEDSGGSSIEVVFVLAVFKILAGKELRKYLLILKEKKDEDCLVLRFLSSTDCATHRTALSGAGLEQ